MNARKNGVNFAITPGQCRGARGTLDWSMEQLSELSGVPMRTLLRFERGEGVPRASTVTAIRAALESAGVEFIPENGAGAGVRLKKI
jgi:transcriptional regulator with XRE-family HTH domain